MEIIVILIDSYNKNIVFYNRGKLIMSNIFKVNTNEYLSHCNLTLEFIPDEPEEINSPLDDIRQELNQDNY